MLASNIGTRGLCAELFDRVINEHDLLTCELVLLELERVAYSHANVTAHNPR